jgi:WD40 repeat protein
LKCCKWLGENNETGESQFVTGGMDSDITVWKWNNNRNDKPTPLYSLRGHHGAVETITMVTEDAICSAGQDKKIKLWRDIAILPEGEEEIR